MNDKKSIGVDVSKETLDLAIYDGVFDFNLHTKVSNNKKGFKKIEPWLNKNNIDINDAFFTMEYTGLYAQNLRIWLESEDIVYFMINPKTMHDYALPFNIKGLGRSKTDFLDSFKIAHYGYINYKEMRPSKLPSTAFLKLRRLVVERELYVRQSVAYLQHRKDFAEFETDEAHQRKESMLAELRAKIRQLDSEVDSIIDSDESLKNNYSLLNSIIGIGRVVALDAIVLTENFSAIRNPRVYAHYIAVAPNKRESGKSVRGGNHTDKKGYRQAKADLSMSALSSIKDDPQIKAYWKRKKAEGKHSGVILNAIKFKLILRMFAVIKKQKPFVKLDF